MQVTVLCAGADLTAGGVAWYVDRMLRHFSGRIHMHLAHSPEVAENGAPAFLGTTRHKLRQRYSWLALPLRVWQFRKLIRHTGANVVHLHTARAGLIGCLACWRLNVGMVFTVHGWRYEQGRSAIARLPYYLCERITCARADAVALICERDKRVGIADGVLRESKGIVINTRIDHSSMLSVRGLRNAEVQKRFGIPEGSKVVGMIGTLDARKDPITFLRIASRIAEKCSDVWFLWVGSGALRHQAEQTARQLAIADRVVFAGNQPGSMMPKMLDAMHILLFTSKIEGVPLAILEAQAALLPVVSSSYQGVEEVVEDGRTGCLYPVGDFQKGAEAVLALLKTPELALAMAEAAHRSFLERHAGPEKMAQGYEAVYRRIAPSCEQ